MRTRIIMSFFTLNYFQWDEDVEVSDIIREYGDIEWLHHNIITQNNIDGIIVGIQFAMSCYKSVQSRGDM